MNKTAIRNFATWARVTLQEGIRQKLGLLGIMPSEILEPLPASNSHTQFFDVGSSQPVEVTGENLRARNQIKQQLTQDRMVDYGTAYQAYVEEMASTWFNRLVAIRYMEVNDYLPDHQRVLSSLIPGKVDPDLVSNPFHSDLQFTVEEQKQIMDWKGHNQVDPLFNFLLRKRCHQLNEWLPGLFEKEKDSSDQFLQFSYVDPNGIVTHLVHDIDEEDFKDQVQIIGWLYQYYNAEWKNDVFAKLKKNIKITKENIPAATQLFTPDWIVRYMVENSLGRLWLLGHPNPELQKKWKYFVPDAKQKPEVEEQINILKKQYAQLKPEDLTLIDPCSGSGHILVYAFDVLMDIYESQGYLEREAAQSILRHNLFGLDIDDRAYQLTYFALMMKARQYDPRIFRRGIKPQVCAIQESNGLEKWSDVKGQLKEEQLSLEDTWIETADYLIDTFQDAKEYGSLLKVEPHNYDGLQQALSQLVAEGTSNLFLSGWLQQVAERMPQLIAQAKLLSTKKWVCSTNPPYLTSSNFAAKLNTFAKKNYPVSKSDLFAMFIERCNVFTLENGFQAMITQHAWMFLSSYEKLRIRVQKRSIVNMIHLGARAFEEISGEVVQVTSFVLQNICIPNYRGSYFRLLEPKSQNEKRDMFLQGKCHFYACQNNFSKIPGQPVAYWFNDIYINKFSKSNLFTNYANAKAGLSTTNNERFLRLWYEVAIDSIGFNYKSTEETKDCKYKYVPNPKGGDYRKWYGNLDYVVNWYNNGNEIRKAAEGASGGRIVGSEYYFKEGITWTDITTYKLAVRLLESGCIFNSSAPSAFFKDENYRYYVLAFLNSVVAMEYLKVLSPTIHYNAGPIQRVPIIMDIINKAEIDRLTEECVKVSKEDWNLFETSWDFQTYPLLAPTNLDMADSVTVSQPTLIERYEQYKTACEDYFDILHGNEEELNRIFIDIYGLQGELTPDVAPKDVTVHRIFDSKDDVPADMQGSNYILTKEDVIKSLLSYAVGCIFGRYSLDTPGLAYAGGEWDAAKYSSFIPDADNVVPITDEDYFPDDLVGQVVQWLGVAFGQEQLETNLEFLTDSLGVKGRTSREKLRNYFLKEFFKDHCKTYQKRPIYWLFDSGRENGFKAFVYIHRWDKDTEGRVLLYLHKVQYKYETELSSIDTELASLQDKRRVAQLEKQREHLEKQLAEVKAYDEALDHMAGEHLAMDLDDGVKVNYEKMQTDRDGVFYLILAKVK